MSQVSPTKSLPPQPNLSQYKTQAKELRQAHQASDPAALARIQTFHPRLGDLHPVEIAESRFTVSDAQWVIAREHGFASWPKFKQHIDSIAQTKPKHRPFVKEIDYYEDRAYGLLSVYETGQQEALQLIRASHPQFTASSDAEILEADFTMEDARLVLAREHGIADWAAFVQHINALTQGTIQEPFMAAYEAIQANDLATLKQILDSDATLIDAPGTNGNRLLTLATSQGNIQIATYLLEAGADVNAANNKGWTPLHAVAYGLPHLGESKQQAALQLMQLLIDAGADVTLNAHGDGGTPLAQALFWGHRPQAEALAAYGLVPDNLRVAAGLGRLDHLKSFFKTDGSLKPEAGLHREYHRPHSGFPPWKPTDDPQEILDEALVYACKSGRTHVLDFLVQMGANVKGEPYNGTGLHWAAANGHIESMKWLLAHGAGLQDRANFGGEKNLPPLHIAAWGGQTETVAYLVAQGADVHIREDRYHGFAWEWAEHANRIETHQALLKLAANTNIFAAMELNQIELVQDLLTKTSQLSNHHDGWTTPLYQAIWSDQLDIAALLLQSGADPNLKQNADSRTPLAEALHRNREKIAKLLRQYRAK